MFSEPTNEDRAERGNQILEAYSGINPDTRGEDSSSVLGDLLADLRHYCHHNSIDFVSALVTSEIQFEAESDEVGISGGEHEVQTAADAKTESLSEASQLANGKTCELVDPSQDQSFKGVFVGCSDHHAVFSLGRTAKIVEMADIQMSPVCLGVGQEARITFRNGAGSLDIVPITKGIER